MSSGRTWHWPPGIQLARHGGPAWRDCNNGFALPPPQLTLGPKETV